MKSPDSIDKQFIVRVQAKKATGGYYLFINIPREIEQKLGLRKGDFLVLKLKGDKVIMKKLKR